MNSRSDSCTVLITAGLLFASGIASAVPTLHTTVLPIYQVSSGASVSLGHVVHATSNYNRLMAGGTFSASCIHPMMAPATGQRTLSTESFGAATSLYVTIPATVPAIVNMPGFYSLNRGETVRCTYNWTARAVESGYSVGAGGVSFQTGNGEQSEGFFQQFVMSVPGTAGSGDFNTCIP